MTIFQAECFLAVAEHLNFAKAAEQMHISQPAITRQIQTLETELNVKLFYRSTRSVKLTAEGWLFLTDAQTIVSASKRAVRRFAQKKPDSISADDLRPYPMVVYDPGAMMIPEAIAGQWEWAKDKGASKLYFCESSETSMLLVGTGLGVTVVPELHVPKDRGLHICPLKKTKLIPFGLYYKSIQSQPCLKDFIRLIKEEF